MKVVKNYLYNALYQIFRILIPFITIPYLSRVLGPKGVGINSFTYSVVQYFVLLGDIGINTYGNRKIAYVRNNKYKLTQTFYEIMIMQICTVGFAYLFFFIFLCFTTHKYNSYYLAQSIAILASALDISWFFMGVENFKVTVLRNFIIRILVLFCIFIFVKSYSDLMLYILLYALSTLIGNISLYPSLKKYIGLPKLHKLQICRHLLPSLALFIPEVAVQVYWVLNKSMLGLIDSTNAAGFYDQSDKTVKIILALVTATGSVMLPHVANAFANGKKHKTIIYLYDSFSFVTSLSIPLSLGLSVISSKFVPLFFTNKFIIVAPLMSIESIIIVLVAWSGVIGTQYLVPTKQTKVYTTSVILGAVLNILINLSIIPFAGVIGSVWATVASESLVTSYQLYSIRNQINFKNLFNDFYKYAISGIIMFLIIYMINRVTPVSWIMIILEIIIGAIIYLIMIIIMKANIFKVINNIIHNY